jgi:uncharacterized protein YheU (UPF0270 family)
MKNEYKVGDHVQISLNNQIMDVVIRAVIEDSSGLRLQVDFGHEQTSLIHEWQVVKEQISSTSALLIVVESLAQTIEQMSISHVAVFGLLQIGPKLG